MTKPRSLVLAPMFPLRRLIEAAALARLLLLTLLPGLAQIDDTEPPMLVSLSLSPD